MRKRTLPTVCAWCRKVRNSQGEWGEADMPDADGHAATHGICPACLDNATRATVAAVAP